MPLERCQSCGHVAGDVTAEDLGLEQLIDLKLAAMLVPTTVKNLVAHLSRHKAEFPATYRVCGHGRKRRRIRVLTPREIKLVRSRVLRGPGVSRYL